MLSFGLAIVALALVVAPGVLFVVCFFTFSIIKRTVISFGPAIDVALFFSLSLLINGLYGGCIGWVTLAVYDPCRQSLLPEINAVIAQLFLGGGAPGRCSPQSSAVTFYIYLALLSLAACLAGNRAVSLVEALGFRFAHGVFTEVSSTARRNGVTTCSALCKFGGDSSYVIYIGEVREIVLDDRNCITHMAIAKAKRSLLRIGRSITASDPAAIPLVGPQDEFIIPGASIENVAFSHFAPTGFSWRGFMRLASLLLLLAPILVSAKLYLEMAANPAGATAPHRAAPVLPLSAGRTQR